MTAAQLIKEPDATAVDEPLLHQQIQRRAYELWEERSKQSIEGTADNDWFAAERELSPGSPITETGSLLGL